MAAGLTVAWSVQNPVPTAYRQPLLLFGGGFLAGLLLFLAWLAMQPARKEGEAPAPVVAAKASGSPVRDPDGVLGDIAAGGGRGDGPAMSSPQDELPSPPPAEPTAEPAAPVDDAQAIAGSLLPEDQPRLQTWYVEVARGPGVSEILQIDAPSAEQALVVLRDFRGNPRVLRGPSPQPFP